MFKRAYIEITNVCNLNCEFCHGTSRLPSFLNEAQFEEILNKLQGYTEYIYFHVMGEPLLHSSLPVFLQLAEQYRYKVCLTTNGTLLQDQLDTLLKTKALHKVSVSLHSMEGNGATNIEKYLNNIWDSVKALSENGTICSLRLWNIGGKNSLNEQIIYFLQSVSGCQIEKNNDRDRQSKKICEGIFLEEAQRFDWPDKEAPIVKTQYCLGLKQQIGILVDGTVVPCCLDADGEIALGNIFTETMDEILHKEKTKAIIEGFERRKPTENLCKRCGYAMRFNK